MPAHPRCRGALPERSATSPGRLLRRTPGRNRRAAAGAPAEPRRQRLHSVTWPRPAQGQRSRRASFPNGNAHKQPTTPPESRDGAPGASTAGFRHGSRRPLRARSGDGRVRRPRRTATPTHTGMVGGLAAPTTPDRSRQASSRSSTEASPTSVALNGASARSPTRNDHCAKSQASFAGFPSPTDLMATDSAGGAPPTMRPPGRPDRPTARSSQPTVRRRSNSASSLASGPRTPSAAATTTARDADNAPSPPSMPARAANRSTTGSHPRRPEHR